MVQTSDGDAAGHEGMEGLQQETNTKLPDHVTFSKVFVKSFGASYIKLINFYTEPQICGAKAQNMFAYLQHALLYVKLSGENAVAALGVDPGLEQLSRQNVASYCISVANRCKNSIQIQ